SGPVQGVKFERTDASGIVSFTPGFRSLSEKDFLCETLCDLCVSVGRNAKESFTTESQRSHREPQSLFSRQTRKLIGKPFKRFPVKASLRDHLAEARCE